MQDYIPYEEVMQEQQEEEMNYYGHLQRTAANIFQQGLTKKEIKPLAEILVNDVLINGNPLAVAENIKVLEEIIKAIKENNKYKDYCLEEITKYNGCYTSSRGARVEKMEAGGRYDYNSCGDPVYNELCQKIKEREAFLKALPKDGQVITIEETGETVKIFPPLKTNSVTTYKVTLPK